LGGRMARKRIRRLDEVCYYHVMSRTVNGEALFKDREKEVFRRMIWRVADFSGVRVVTYAVMKNHFHILVEVPEKKTEISDEELVRRFRVLYPRPTPWQPMRAEVLARHLAEGTPEGNVLRAELLERMHDVSEFMKTLKLRFTLWFNRTKERFGPLWSARFKSVLVEGDRWALRTVAAYIDLNAVRAGLVRDPRDYRFCGYGEALGGGRAARAGLGIIDRDMAGYRQTLYGYGAYEKEGKVPISRKEAVRVLEKDRGKLPLAVVLRCRVRYLTDGAILGTAEFVRRQLEAHPPPKRKPTPRPMKGADWKGLAVSTGIKTNVFQ